MKIYFIREKNSNFGGAENYLSRLSKSLESKEIEHEVINSPFPKFLPSWVRVILFNLYLCIIKKGKFFFSLERIYCPDIYRAGDGVHRVFMKNLAKSKINPLHIILLFLEKRCFHSAKLIIANSKMVKKDIIVNYGVNPNKIMIIYNGVELVKKRPINKKYFLELNNLNHVSIKKKIFLFVGNGFERKGLESFLEILTNLNKNLFHAFVIGHDKKIQDYISLARNIGLAENVNYLGNRKDVNDFYQISDFVILPTRYDPFSNVILEAMFFKNIVITTKQNGAHEILDKKWVMNSFKDFSISKEINGIIKNDQLITKLQQSNYLIAKSFSIEKNSKKTLECIGC